MKIHKVKIFMMNDSRIFVSALGFIVTILQDGDFFIEPAYDFYLKIFLASNSISKDLLRWTLDATQTKSI